MILKMIFREIPSGRYRRRNFNKLYQDYDWLSTINNIFGSSIRIANSIGISHVTIYEWMLKHSIPRLNKRKKLITIRKNKRKKDKKLFVLNFLSDYVKRHHFISFKSTSTELIEEYQKQFSFYNRLASNQEISRMLRSYFTHLSIYKGIEKISTRNYKINDSCVKLIIDTIEGNRKFHWYDKKKDMDYTETLLRIENTKPDWIALPFLDFRNETDDHFKELYNEVINSEKDLFCSPGRSLEIKTRV